MMRIVLLCLVLVIAITGWLGFDQHRRALARQAEADVALAAAQAEVESARAQARARSKPTAGPSSEPALVPTAPLAPSLYAPQSSGGSTTASGFSCDGRTHCSQMHSCAEAQYFLRNCPGVKMDGNHDGEPCEQQFPECGS